MVKLLVVAAVGCGAHAAATPTLPPADVDIALYRDRAMIRQRATVDVARRDATLVVKLASDATAEQIAIVDRGGLAVRGLHGESDGLHVDVSAPHPGRFTLALAYTTERLKWDAAYTMTTTPSRDRVVLHGALAIRNGTGVVWRDAAVRVIDAELAAARQRIAGKLAADLVGGTPDSRPQAPPRELGRVDLGDGETRVELLADDRAHAMRSVLVYDPIGTKLDVPSTAPARDPALGVKPPAPTNVTESFEVERDEREVAGLPAGPVRLLERHGDGSLVVLGESRLFDTQTNSASYDTIAIGTADGITAHRERREYTVDDDNRRLVEEFVITIDNERPQPAHVVLREHLYRGLNWHLPYPLPPIAEREGDQQIALRVTVPAHATAKQLYVVVYTWDR